MSFKQFMFLYKINTIGFWNDIIFFAPRSTDKVRSSFFVELMPHF